MEKRSESRMDCLRYLPSIQSRLHGWVRCSLWFFFRSEAPSNFDEVKECDFSLFGTFHRKMLDRMRVFSALTVRSCIPIERFECRRCTTCNRQRGRCDTWPFLTGITGTQFEFQWTKAIWGGVCNGAQFIDPRLRPIWMGTTASYPLKGATHLNTPYRFIYLIEASAAFRNAWVLF